MLKQAGSRITRARLAILHILLESDVALSHNELETIMAKRDIPVEKVTVYRILEWLVEHQLAHKVTGQDRVWRFNAGGEIHREHAHFNCTACGQITCLETRQAASKLIDLPPGFILHETDLTLQGICSSCSH